jgi:hypothetical protein
MYLRGEPRPLALHEAYMMPCEGICDRRHLLSGPSRAREAYVPLRSKLSESAPSRYHVRAFKRL